MREMLNFINRSGSDNDLRTTIQYGGDYQRYVIRVVLVIGIRIYDDINTQLNTGFDAVHECPCQAVVTDMIHNKIHSVFLGELNCSICTPIVNYKLFY